MMKIYKNESGKSPMATYGIRLTPVAITHRHLITQHMQRRVETPPRHGIILKTKRPGGWYPGRQGQLPGKAGQPQAAGGAAQANAKPGGGQAVCLNLPVHARGHCASGQG